MKVESRITFLCERRVKTIVETDTKSAEMCSEFIYYGLSCGLANSSFHHNHVSNFKCGVT